MKKLITLALVAAILAGCAPPSSPERHARHYVLTAMETHDANLVVDKQGSIKSMLPMFEEAYKTGQNDRLARTDYMTAQRRAMGFSNIFMENRESKFGFSPVAGEEHTITLSVREAKILGDSIAETYLDGYKGN